MVNVKPDPALSKAKNYASYKKEHDPSRETVPFS